MKMKLRVWWIPQVPMKSFHVEVNTVEDAVLVIKTLTDYDSFQFENNVKPDYSNAGGLEMFEDGKWTDWNNGLFDDVDELIDSLNN